MDRGKRHTIKIKVEEDNILTIRMATAGVSPSDHEVEEAIRRGCNSINLSHKAVYEALLYRVNDKRILRKKRISTERFWLVWLEDNVVMTRKA